MVAWISTYLWFKHSPCASDVQGGRYGSNDSESSKTPCQSNGRDDRRWPCHLSWGVAFQADTATGSIKEWFLTQLVSEFRWDVLTHACKWEKSLERCCTQALVDSFSSRVPCDDFFHFYIKTWLCGKITRESHLVHILNILLTLMYLLHIIFGSSVILALNGI